MAMTRRERLGKQEIYKKMASTGYPTYANLFSLFDLHLTEDPGVVAYMVPEKAEITINENLDIEQASTVVRHEILHEFLDHMKRYQRIPNKPQGKDPFFNVAADYEISNLGYTDEDKENARAIRIGGKSLQGLVTDYDHPDWVDKSFEEMYELLRKESPESMKDPHIGNRGSEQIQKAEEAKRRAEAIKEKAEQQEQSAQQEMDQSGGSDSMGDNSDSGSQSGGQSQSSDSGQSSSSSDDSSSGSDSGSPSGDDSSGSSSSGGGDEKKKGRNHYDDEAYKNMSPEEKKKERARRRREAAKKIKEEADKLIDDLNEVLDKDGNGQNDRDDKATGSSGSGDAPVFDTPEEQKEIEERIKGIKKILGNLEDQQSALMESRTAILKEKAVKDSEVAKKYRDSPLTKFTESLTKFIRDELAKGRQDSWSHINKKYVYSGLLRPGSTWQGKNKVPLINVYFDRSGSWTTEKTEKGAQAIATLNRYVTRGEIKLKLYYFNTRVMDTDPGGHGGTNGQPIMDHIQQTKPNNVIILTDSDISDIRTDVSVPGAVWMLFYGGRSINLMEHLHGKKLTKYFDIIKQG